MTMRNVIETGKIVYGKQTARVQLRLSCGHYRKVKCSLKNGKPDVYRYLFCQQCADKFKRIAGE